MKQVMQLIWRRYLRVVWGPLCHFLQPGSKLYDHAKTARLHCLFAFMRLAYPSFKSELDAAISTLALRSTDGVALTWLLNIKDMCVFFIPLVPSRYCFKFL
jgi:hypothetical protein